jgi:putative endonuclease
VKIAQLLQRFSLGRAPGKETATQATGRKGEERAEDFLRREKGFRTIARNWRHEKDEIDLVCWDRDVLVFVEVKTRAAGAMVPGYYAVDKRKKEALRRVFGQYLKKLRRKPATFRFDVVEVAVAADGACEVLHFENIPLFPKGYHW